MLATAVVVVTEVGTPADPYTAAPDPCEILTDETIRHLIDDPRPPNRANRTGDRRALHRDPDRRSCFQDSQSLAVGTHGSIRAWAYRFHSTQLRLGPDGARRAETQYHTEREIIASAHHTQCEDLVVNPPAVACGVVLDTALRVLIRVDNLYFVVEWYPGHRETRPASPALASRIADDVLSSLD